MAVGPGAPTLCDGWTTRDLAVHLMVRESRPDAMVGMFLRPLQKHMEAVSRAVARRSYGDLVATYRKGPPVWNPMRLVDPWMNLSENFVHHEDVRRGGGEWTSRDLPPSTKDALWRAARLAARGFLVPSGPTVQLVRSDGRGGEVTVGRGAPDVTVTGESSEILLWLFGKDKVCDLTIVGPVERVVRREL